MRTATFATALAALIGCASGCLKPAFPQLHPVRGVVTYDGKPAKGGVIQFRPVGDHPKFIFSGLVMMDGTYTLNTSRVSDSKADLRPGAPAGEFTVTYTPLAKAEGSDASESIRAPMIAVVKAGDNDISIRVPKK